MYLDSINTCRTFFLLKKFKIHYMNIPETATFLSNFAFSWNDLYTKMIGKQYSTTDEKSRVNRQMICEVCQKIFKTNGTIENTKVVTLGQKLII